MRKRVTWTDMHKNTRAAVVCALTAAVFYAVSTPFSKILLRRVAPTFMAAFLYLGAGTGVGLLYCFRAGKEDRSQRLSRADLPYTLGMILLDIAAPILLMFGIRTGSASNASLLGNFEIVATALIALLVFGEKVSGRLWTAIALICLSSAVLTFDGAGSFRFALGSVFVLAATCCWGLENNCTRKISQKSTYEIVLLKGLFSGGGSFLLSLALGETLPPPGYAAAAMLLGFLSYGLSIFLYVRAQRDLGAARTSAYYAVAPFVGTFLAFLVTGEKLTVTYFIGLLFMVAGTVFVVRDTFYKEHSQADGRAGR